MTPRVYEPRDFAPLVSSFFAHRPRCQLWAKPGMGKTVLTLTHVVNGIELCGDSFPTLIVAPKRVARDGWVAEAAKWQHLKHLEIVPVLGSPEERDRALKRLGRAQVFTINYDNLLWLKEWFDSRLIAWPFRRVVPDEATKLKGFRVQQGGVRAAALGSVAHKHAREWINLTGTPSPNGLKDLWGQSWFVDEGQRLGRSYSAFEERWFAYKRVKDAISHKVGIVPVIMPFAQEQIMDRLKDICLSLDPRDWFDLQEPIVNIIPVRLPASARAKYNELEREMFTRIGGFDVEVFNAAALTNKTLQAANGAVYVDPERYGKGAWVEVHDEKLEALAEHCDATGDEPLLVAYQFQSDLARLKRRFPDALVLGEDADLARAKKGEGKLWLAHPASVGHGVDGLQRWCNRLVYFAQDWNLEYHDQLLERVGPMRQYQEGCTDGFFIDYIVAEDTIDEVVVARRDSKRSVQNCLMDFMKERNR
jgi:hypothetical protein